MTASIHISPAELKYISEQFSSYRYWYLYKDKQEITCLFDAETNIIWNISLVESGVFSYSEAKSMASNIKEHAFKQWRLPTEKEFNLFLADNNPYIAAGLSKNLLSYTNWVMHSGAINIETRVVISKGHSLYCNVELVGLKEPEDRLYKIFDDGWSLSCCENLEIELERMFTDPSVLNISHSFASAAKKSPSKSAIGDSIKPATNIRTKDAQFSDIDYERVRLPKFEKEQYTDPHKGLWELYSADENKQADIKASGLIARNPVKDIISSTHVAIDFGTSSTVVAYEEQGRKKLLRIGVRDYDSAPEAKHYENPTVLEFIDLPAVLKAWQSQAYSPEVRWDSVHCSHEAQTRLRDNATDPDIVASILTKMKQWALYNSVEGKRTRIADQVHKKEYILEALSSRMPDTGQLLQVSDKDIFNPIELYAWFLGLTINWRKRGIFLKYYMTFPVAYSRDVKDKILASFSRGLQRSLPESLVNQDAFNDFSVEERASEPAAYAASALPLLGIEPTESGIAYAVFDFGGGTTDFDFGYYRLPTAEEDDLGYEEVFEHFGAASDVYLGGENLLENMAYWVFRGNLEHCREKKIAFTQPIDALDFQGSEMFLDCTQSAQTNSLILISKLRPLWERGALEGSAGVIKLKLLDRYGIKQDCELRVKQAELFAYLEKRITQGVINFYSAMKKGFHESQPKTINVILGGNASRSSIVRDIFSTNELEVERMADTLDVEKDTAKKGVDSNPLLTQIYGERAPQLIFHLPLEVNLEDLEQATCKTGVALGLLSLCPGSTTKVINHAVKKFEGEAPFAYYIGKIKRKFFNATLEQGAVYFEWHLLGPIRERIFNLVVTQSPHANTNTLPKEDTSLLYKRLYFTGNTAEQKAYVRAISPDVIEVCTAYSLEALTNKKLENLQKIALKSLGE